MIQTLARIIAAHLLVLSPAVGLAEESDDTARPQYIVSMVQLLARPSDLEAKTIIVRGYLHAGAGMRLYLTEDHAKIADVASSIPVEDPGPEMMGCTGSYVAVNGLFGLGEEYGILKTLEVIRSSQAGSSTCWKREAVDGE